MKMTETMKVLLVGPRRALSSSRLLTPPTQYIIGAIGFESNGEGRATAAGVKFFQLGEVTGYYLTFCLFGCSVVARNNSILKQLVLQAKREYEAEAIHRIQIYFADSHGSWRWTDSRHKRPMNSIVLNPGVKEMLLNDTRDFLKSEKVSQVYL